MPVKCQVIMDAIDKLAPRYLAEDWDNVGLLIGSPAQVVDNILVSLDITEDVIEKAVEKGVNLIISHHPLIFKPLAHLRTDNPQGRIIARLLKNDIAVFAAHTNLDTAAGGVNDILAQRLSLQGIEMLTSSFSERLVKLAVFVPKDYIEEVRNAITEAGAGYIGNYSHCTFYTEGIGTFLPLEGTSPFIGEKGKLEFVQELRLETVFPERISKRIIKAMLRSHPYEEVAYDVYPLHNAGKELGLGRIGKLVSTKTLEELTLEVKKILNIEWVRVVGDPGKTVNKVAVCGGSGAGLIKRAAFMGADVLITGDVKYHEAQEALSLGVSLIDAGHFATEIPVVDSIVEHLEKSASAGKWDIRIFADSFSKDIFTFVK
ncbi:Nif3-like dinuclear metal center hexameric protein [Dendrosporobacter sp. 1207_IL3150]|uniref:Nif3-like dinuclear metal center hexameric protein n=1 Tax=Dendrosporobacter sp. 1207_IL3150 TaxID=3084054 RepID=UPI002FD8B2D4